jgi:hypothetical protein
MKWVGHAEHMGYMGNEYKILVKNIKAKDCLGE